MCGCWVYERGGLSACPGGVLTDPFSVAACCQVPVLPHRKDFFSLRAIACAPDTRPSCSGASKWADEIACSGVTAEAMGPPRAWGNPSEEDRHAVRRRPQPQEPNTTLLTHHLINEKKIGIHYQFVVCVWTATVRTRGGRAGRSSMVARVATLRSSLVVIQLSPSVSLLSHRAAGTL